MYVDLHLRLLDIPRQPTCMKLRYYQRIQSYKQGSYNVICLGISNNSVAVPRQDSMSPVYLKLDSHACSTYTDPLRQLICRVVNTLMS